MPWLRLFASGMERSALAFVALIGGLAMTTPLSAASSVFPKGRRPADTVDVVNLADATPSMRLSLTMLQGLANRGPRTRVYVLQPGPSDAFWLEHLKRKGYLKHTRTLSPDEFVAKYAKVYRKVFVYDPSLTGSMNAACMLGALEGGLACHPDDAARLAGGRPVEDLRGRWSANAEAIAWADRSLRPRMNARMLASMNPQGPEISLFDYLTAHRVFTFWITSKEKADRKGTSHEAEREAVEAVLRTARPNTPVLGFWFSGVDHGINEYTGVGLAGETGQYTVVTSLSSNLTLLSGVNVDWNSAVKRYHARLAEREAPTLDPNKIYVCFEFTESGDSPFYLQHVQWREWQDPARGRLPFNWNVGPTVLDLAGPIIEYFYDQATPNDFFYVALSGAGYNHPYRNLFGKVRDPQASWREYVALTSSYMRRMGLRDLQLYTDAWMPFDRARHDAVTLRFVDGIPNLRSVVLGMGRDGELTGDTGNYRLGKRDVLVSHCLTRWDPDYAGKSKEQQIDWLVNDVRAHAPAARPGFMHAMVLSWPYDPTEYVEIVRRLGPEYVPVTIPEYVRLFAEAQQRQQASGASGR